MPANITDLLAKVGNPGTLTSMSAPGKALAAASISVGSLTNWPTDTAVYFGIRRIDSTLISATNPSGTVPGSYTEWKGIASGTTISNLTLQYGTDQVYPAGTSTQVFIVVSSSRENAIVTWGLAHADQSGDLLPAAVNKALGIANTTNSSFSPLSVTPNTVTYNGNRSYTMVFNGTDQTTTVSPGMRLRTHRTVAAPTQSTSLNGTSQYWSRTGANGMTFTNNFTVMAWIKLDRYSSPTLGTIIRRGPGSDGWGMRVNNSGQLDVFGGAASTYDVYVSRQSVPLNKWVQVAATIDMAANTCLMYIDGVSVPLSQTTVGPAALVNTGDIYVGRNSAANDEYFPGKIAQVAVFSSILTEATIKSYYSQGLTGSETSLVSAYSFNGVATDLNSTNANNLTATAGAGYTADAPWGSQADGTISSTLDYAIVQKTAFSTNTTLTVQVPEGCTIPTTGGITSVAYSSQKAPYGFPTRRDKWTVSMVLLNTVIASGGVAGTIYNPGGINLTVPNGEWVVTKQIEIQVSTSGNTIDAYTTLSTSPTAFDINTVAFSERTLIAQAASSNPFLTALHRTAAFSCNTPTPLYVLIRSNNASTSIQLRGDIVTPTTAGEASIISAENTYL